MNIERHFSLITYIILSITFCRSSGNPGNVQVRKKAVLKYKRHSIPLENRDGYLLENILTHFDIIKIVKKLAECIVFLRIVLVRKS